METKYLTKNEIIEETGLKYYQLDYLVRSNQVPVIMRGSGRRRLYPPKALKIIKKWKSQKGLE